MASDVGWELYRSFLAVLDEGSLSGAARALGIAQPTVGRHVAALEHSLGLPLFTRSHVGLLPTEAAGDLRTHAVAMQSAAAALKRAASSTAPASTASSASPRATSSASRCCRRSLPACGIGIPG